MNRLNIQYISDLHLEGKGRFGSWWEKVIIPKAPYLVLAGDISPISYPDLSNFYYWCIDNFDKTIHIPGNHEYWGNNTMYETEMNMKTLCTEFGITFAQKDVIELQPNAPKLACCTLWSEVPSNSKGGNDWYMIKDFSHQLRNRIYYDHLNFIEHVIDNEGIPPIIVTHHAPLDVGTQRKEHIGTNSTPFYTNNLDYLIDECTAWIFGHTHHVCDIHRDSGTIVTSNPIGHINEKLPFHKSAVLTVKY